MDHLISEAGRRVEMVGRLDSQSPLRVILWAPNPWEPNHEQRFEGGSVAVALREPQEFPNGALVRAAGLWNGESITDGVLAHAPGGQVARSAGSSAKLTSGEAGESTFLATLKSVRASGAPVLATGSSKTTAWVYVLHVTPQLAEAQEKSPVQLDIFTSITPVH